MVDALTRGLPSWKGVNSPHTSSDAYRWLILASHPFSDTPKSNSSADTTGVNHPPIRTTSGDPPIPTPPGRGPPNRPPRKVAPVYALVPGGLALIFFSGIGVWCMRKRNARRRDLRPALTNDAASGGGGVASAMINGIGEGPETHKTTADLDMPRRPDAMLSTGPRGAIAPLVTSERAISVDSGYIASSEQQFTGDGGHYAGSISPGRVPECVKLLPSAVSSLMFLPLIGWLTGYHCLPCLWTVLTMRSRPQPYLRHHRVPP